MVKFLYLVKLEQIKRTLKKLKDTAEKGIDKNVLTHIFSLDYDYYDFHFLILKTKTTHITIKLSIEAAVINLHKSLMLFYF